MDDIHLSREILRAVEAGVLSRSILDEIKTEHLLSRCPHCRAEAEAFEAERRAKGSVLHQIFQIVSLLLERLVTLSSRESARARRDLRELLLLSQDKRLEKVDRARTRFCSLSLVQLVLVESQQRIPGEPGEAFALAELARRIANRNPRIPAYFDVYVLATATMANARRAGGDLQEASRLFVLVRQVIAEHGVTDPAVVARVDDLLGSLRKDQRRFGEAEKLLKRAVMQFRLIQSQADAARGLVNLGAVHYHQKKLDAAIETTRSALALLGPDADPRLHLCGTYNLAFYLTGAGRFEEAAELLEWNEGLFRRFPEPWTQLRLLWLQGDIAAGLGELAAAERAYRETRDGFVAQEDRVRRRHGVSRSRGPLPAAGADGRRAADCRGDDPALPGAGRPPGGAGRSRSLSGGRPPGPAHGREGSRGRGLLARGEA